MIGNGGAARLGVLIAFDSGDKFCASGGGGYGVGEVRVGVAQRDVAQRGPLALADVGQGEADR